MRILFSWVILMGMVTYGYGDGLVFNFGPDQVAVPKGVVNVGASPFRAAQGWGWEKPADVLRKRGKKENVLLDTLAAVSDKVSGGAVFAVALSPGIYEIEVGLSDPGFRYTAKLFVQNEASP